MAFSDIAVRLIPVVLPLLVCRLWVVVQSCAIQNLQEDFM